MVVDTAVEEAGMEDATTGVTTIAAAAAAAAAPGINYNSRFTLQLHQPALLVTRSCSAPVAAPIYFRDV